MQLDAHSRLRMREPKCLDDPLANTVVRSRRRKGLCAAPVRLVEHDESTTPNVFDERTKHSHRIGLKHQDVATYHRVKISCKR